MTGSCPQRGAHSGRAGPRPVRGRDPPRRARAVRQRLHPPGPRTPCTPHPRPSSGIPQTLPGGPGTPGGVETRDPQGTLPAALSPPPGGCLCGLRALRPSRGPNPKAWALHRSPRRGPEPSVRADEDGAAVATAGCRAAVRSHPADPCDRAGAHLVASGKVETGAGGAAGGRADARVSRTTGCRVPEPGGRRDLQRPRNLLGPRVSEGQGLPGAMPAALQHQEPHQWECGRPGPRHLGPPGQEPRCRLGLDHISRPPSISTLTTPLKGSSRMESPTIFTKGHMGTCENLGLQ
ncbi:proline-rich protein 2-like [Choloepus didactylus]|uniref:proline-rich protein 2-like n=1 Tax=Choloepus didactylus TaxID=27675 RepID=UPI0018A05322|nr:proline-rich protein 2-like [Choloepus didactylus]